MIVIPLGDVRSFNIIYTKPEWPMWLLCSRRKGTGEVQVGEPGDFIRNDYCPNRCTGGMMEFGESPLNRMGRNYIEARIKIVDDDLWRKITQASHPAFCGIKLKPMEMSHGKET